MVDHEDKSILPRHCRNCKEMVNIDNELEFTSQWAIIPARVRYDPKLPPNAKLIFGEIAAKTNVYGFCFASNKWFADRFQMQPDSVAGLIKKLEAAGYVMIQIDQHQDNEHKRHIFITQRAFEFLEPPEKFPGVGPGKKSGGEPRKNFRGGPGKKSGVHIIENNKLKYTPISPSAWMPMDVFCAIGDWCGDDSEMTRAWMDYAEMRHRIKRAVTTVATVTRACATLERLSKGDRAYMLGMLKKATDRSWRGLFALEPGDEGYKDQNRPGEEPQSGPEENGGYELWT